LGVAITSLNCNQRLAKGREKFGARLQTKLTPLRMGNFKKEKSRRGREAESKPDAMAHVKVKGENFYRDAKKVKKVNMYKEGKPVRNAAGDIIKAAPYQSKEIPKARVEPNRRWFGNTRVIAQSALAEFRERIGSKICMFLLSMCPRGLPVADPYQVLLRRNKLPLSLLQDSTAVSL
jgi:nuclear GTP-binding protein